jgi:hypothetical protein
MRKAAIIALLLPLLSVGQAPQAGLDTAIMRIGEQVTLTLVVDYRPDERPVTVQWPVVGDTLTRLVEVVRRSTVDTIQPDAEIAPLAFQIVQRLILTSFDSGYHAIPPFKFLINGRPTETQALLLEVRTVELDSANALRDIRDIIEPPFSLLFWVQENAMWIGGILALAMLAGILWWHLRKRPRTSPVLPVPVQQVPLHERILAELRTVEAERLWQQGMHKAYHSRVTDLLRSYIEERYGVPALERTTDELLQELRVSPLTRDQQTRLANMLRSADMVKFAKALPAPAENEQMMIGAIRLVEETADRSGPSVASGVTRHAN